MDMAIRKILSTTAMAVCLALALAVALPVATDAATAKEIDMRVDDALNRFDKHVSGGKEFARSAKGVLVFPEVFKAGFIVGAEGGEGALRVGGKTVDYYNTIGVSFGFQAGVQAKTVILVFMQEGALKKFRSSPGFEVGVDGSVALIEVGAGGSIDTTTIQDPIVGFVFGQKGLMFNLTLEGSKFSKIKR